MKYFAKYIPVEGEIKEGDYWQSPSGQIHHHTLPFAITSDVPKKVKLFLCSRDIQVGDKFRYGGQEGDLSREYLCVSDEENADEYRINISIVGRCDFKVIGEISPEATWIKEGDEFDDDEFKLATDVLRPKKGTQGEYLPPWAWMKCKCCGEFN